MKHGRQMTPEELADWRKSFDDIDESIRGLDKKSAVSIKQQRGKGAKK